MDKGVFKAHLLPLLVLTPLIFALHFFILKPHLRYAFADVDWMFLITYKDLSLIYHNPISHFLHGWERWGVYTYQIYYIGLIEQFFGFNYQTFQIVTILLKIIATFSIYPLVYLLTKSKLTAFLTVLLYAVTYPSVGVMYTVVTSGLFVAIPAMSLFFTWYGYLISKGRNNTGDILILATLFFITLLLATERMYPLIPMVILIEFFFWLKNNFSRAYLFQGLKRLFPFFCLFLVVFIFRPSTFTLLSGNTQITYQKFILGNWHVILSPFISLGSLVLPREYWFILGGVSIDNIYTYLTYLLTGPMVIFAFITIFLSFFLSQKKLNFILFNLILTFFFSLVIYILSKHSLSISSSFRANFDQPNINPALIGVYIIVTSLSLFKEWIQGGKNNRILISMAGGIVLSVVFVFMTWIFADHALIFSGVHRYLTIPAIGLSLLVAGLFTSIFRKLKNNKITKTVAYMFFFLLIPIISFNAKVITDSFNYELNYEGTDVTGHIRMKSKLWSYLTNFSKTDPSLFYFDESADHDNGYFDETTIMAGFNYWMRFRENNILPESLAPKLIRSYYLCGGYGKVCPEKLKEMIVEKKGIKGFLYGGVWYKIDNFYAFKFKDKDLFDIKDETLKTLGLY